MRSQDTSSHDSRTTANNKENLNQEKAAVLIQSYFREYTMRKKRWSPELEAKAKHIIGSAKNRGEALKMMQKEGFLAEEAARIIQRFYRTQRNKDKISSPNRRKTPSSPNKKGLSPRDQQLELIEFSQNVHMLNQNAHKHLRKSNKDVPLDRIEKSPAEYKRQTGFSMIPGLLGQILGNGHHQDHDVVSLSQRSD
jgi:myosin III